ncbi:MAG: M20/M25/M40 family metallo-hydrolase [Solirubrobacterales bacterium]|nr:M20/M25/M40 family metallo-hydrolase [Solirubrobacterales bacterium]
MPAVPRRVPLALVAASAAALSLTPAAPAQAARKGTDLRLSNSTGVPSTIAPGGQFTLRTTVKNAGRRSAKAPRVFVSLVRGSSTKPTTPRAGSRTLPAFRKGRTTRYSLTVRISSGRSGTYRVLVCVTQAGRKSRCYLGRQIVVKKPTPPVTTPPVTPPTPEPPLAPLDQRLRAAMSADQLLAHTNALADAADRNGGTRAAGTQGYDDSATYVINRLAKAGYEPRIDRFNFILFSEQADPQFTSSVATYTFPDDYVTMEYSGSGDTGAGKPITAIDLGTTPTPDDAPPSSNTSGCEAADFAGFPAGNIALVKRGTCAFADKAKNASDAGASGVIIFNEGQPGREETLNGTLGGPVAGGEDVPVIGTSAAVGEALAAAVAPTGRIVTQTKNEPGSSYNVLADTPGGDAAKTIVVGAHLDSVAEGAGINDNGSGTSFVLELAEQVAALNVSPKNKVRFAFWGAEEAGLIGSTEYVAGLTDAEFGQIGLNLNFDMLASPNHARFVYDGDFSDSTPPGGAALAPGSADVEKAFVDYFKSQNLASAPTGFDGRSDYKAFQDNGVPAGGLFSGAEDVKTEAEVALFGGTAGEAFDKNYHQAGDTRTNLNVTGFEQMADAAATVALQYATADALPKKYGAPAGLRKATKQRASRSERLGSHLQR